MRVSCTGLDGPTTNPCGQRARGFVDFNIRSSYTFGNRLFIRVSIIFSFSVRQGMDVVRAVEFCGTDSGKPKRTVKIVDCGEI